jgi:hypothetical protein
MIHQAKSNPQLLDEQIFSERLASAISAIGIRFRAQSGKHVLALSFSGFDPGCVKTRKIER